MFLNARINKFITLISNRMNDEKYKSNKELQKINDDLLNLKKLNNDIYKIDMILDTINFFNSEEIANIKKEANIDEIKKIKENIDEISNINSALDVSKNIKDITNMNVALIRVYLTIEAKINKKVLNIKNEVAKEVTSNFDLPSMSYNTLLNKINDANKSDNTDRLKKLQKVKFIIDDKIKRTINNDTNLTILKERFHSLLSLVQNPYFRENNIDTNSIYDSLSKNEILEMFGTKKFYKLNKNEVIQLCQAFANKYTSENNIPNVPIIFNDSKRKNYGAYNTFGNYIKINENYLGLFLLQQQNNTNNSFLPYKILNTLIHECRHSAQVNKISKNNEEKFIKNATIIEIHNRKKFEKDPYAVNYHSKINELDAFNESYSYMFKLSKLNIENADKIRNFAVNDIPVCYFAKNTVFANAVQLVLSGGLTPDLNKNVFEVLKYLKVFNNDDIIYDNKTNIDYEKTIENFVHNLNDEKIKEVENTEMQTRVNLFNYLYDYDNLVKKYNSNLTADEIEENSKRFKKDENELKSYNKSNTLI